MAKKKKFNQIWQNQTKIGKKFGISTIKLGKFLKDKGLKEDSGKATKEAVTKGFAKSTPLKDGTSFYLWNKEKVTALLQEEFNPISKEEYWFNEVDTFYKSLLREENDKLQSIGMQCLFDEVPSQYLESVKNKFEEKYGC